MHIYGNYCTGQVKEDALDRFSVPVVPNTIRVDGKGSLSLLNHSSGRTVWLQLQDSMGS